MPSSRGSTPPAKSAGPATTVTSAQSRARSGFSGGSFGTPFNTDSTPATERMTRATTAHRTDSQDEIVTRIVDFAEELAVKTWNLMKMGELSEGLGLLASVEDPEMPDFVKIERRAKESMRNKYAQLGDEDFPSSRPRAQSAHSFVSAESTRAAAAAFAQGKPIRTPHSSTPSATIMVPVEMALAPQGKSIAIGVARRGSKWNVKFTEGEAETGELQARSPRFADAASHIGSKVDFATDSLAVGSVLTIDTTRSSSFLDEKIDAGSRRSPSFPSPRRMGSRSRSAAEAKMRARRAKREMMMLIDLHERMEREKHLMSIHELLEQKRKEYHESVVQETIEKSAKSKARRAYLEAQHVLITKHDEEVRKLEREEKLKKRHQFMTTLRSGTRVAEGSKANYFKQFKPLLDDTASRKSSLHALGPTLLFPESQGQSLVPAVNDFGRKLSMLSIAPDEGGNLPKSRTLQAVSASSKRQVDGDLTSVQEVTISSPEHDQPIQKPRRIVSKYGISVHPKSVKPALQILSSNRLILPMLASLDREIISLDRSAVFWEPSLAPPLNVKWEKHHEKYSMMADAALRNKVVTTKLLRAVNKRHQAPVPPINGSRYASVIESSFSMIEGIPFNPKSRAVSMMEPTPAENADDGQVDIMKVQKSILDSSRRSSFVPSRATSSKSKAVSAKASRPPLASVPLEAVPASVRPSQSSFIQTSSRANSVIQDSLGRPPSGRISQSARSRIASRQNSILNDNSGVPKRSAASATTVTWMTADAVAGLGAGTRAKSAEDGELASDDTVPIFAVPTEHLQSKYSQEQIPNLSGVDVVVHGSLELVKVVASRHASTTTEPEMVIPNVLFPQPTSKVHTITALSDSMEMKTSPSHTLEGRPSPASLHLNKGIYPEPEITFSVNKEVPAAVSPTPNSNFSKVEIPTQRIPVYWLAGSGEFKDLDGAAAAEEKELPQRERVVVPLKMEDLLEGEAQIRITEGKLHRKTKWTNNVFK